MSWTPTRSRRCMTGDVIDYLAAETAAVYYLTDLLLMTMAWRSRQSVNAVLHSEYDPTAQWKVLFNKFYNCNNSSAFHSEPDYANLDLKIWPSITYICTTDSVCVCVHEDSILRGWISRGQLDCVHVLVRVTVHACIYSEHAWSAYM